jgi:polyhydroxyalkanoate synthesis regulator phasin
MLLNEIYDKLAEEWQMTSEEVQNAIYKEWYKKYQQASEQKGSKLKKALTKFLNKYRTSERAEGII